MKPIIEVNQLSKKYKYGEYLPYYTLRDALSNLVHPSNSENFPGKTLSKDEFWALKDVSFSINPGEAVGIIGSNGAGKSTLLKILSRITPPTSGSAILRGKVGSLLEIGTGFHQELTGRENIFLNGAILGMKKQEINKKLDEIIEFSGVGKFLDMPVKHYSSGMYTRLAFSVAANLETEILIIDEVLAVGDSEFQKKCLSKIKNVTQKEGRTALFVSHNMSSIEGLCQRCILLDSGKIKQVGHTSSVISKYKNQDFKESNLIKRADRKGNGKIKISKVNFKNNKNNEGNKILAGENCEIDIHYEIKSKDIKDLNISVGIDSDVSSSRIAFISNKIISKKIIPKDGSPINITIDKLPLISGQYSITIFLDSNGETLDWIKNAASFTVISSDSYSDRLVRPLGQGDTLLKYDVK